MVGLRRHSPHPLAHFGGIDGGVELMLEVSGGGRGLRRRLRRAKTHAGGDGEKEDETAHEGPR